MTEGDNMPPILEIQNVFKNYDGKNAVLEGVSLSLNKGEVIVLIGPSGCGKSTLLRCINGLEEIQGGTVRLDGETIDYRKKDLTWLRQRIGMVFQSYELFPHMSIIENIILAPMKVMGTDRKSAAKEALALLERVGLAHKADAYPRELSGGQKQRVAIVRVLAMHPEIMLFDEVTAALDPEMVREVLDVMLALAKGGSTMIIVTHEMQFAEAVADRVYFLDKGKIVETGSPKSFFTAPKTERARQFLNIFEFESVKDDKEEYNI